MHVLVFTAVIILATQGELTTTEKIEDDIHYHHSDFENLSDERIENENDGQPCINNNKLMTISKILQLSGNDTAWVIDNAIQPCSAELWIRSFQFFDSGSSGGFVFNHMNYSRRTSPSEWNYGLPPWTKFVNIEELIKTSSWNQISGIVEAILKTKMKVVSGKYEVLRSMDAMVPTVSSDCHPHQYVLSIFLHKMWNLNNYGQVSFYNISNFDPNDQHWEICATVHPHPYRAILWPSCHPVLFRAPCINHFYHLKVLNVRLTSDLNALPGSAPGWYIDEDIADKFALFTFADPSPVIDFSKHLVRKFDDGNPNRQVLIFDDLFTHDELVKWRHHVLKAHPNYQSFDGAALEDHDNVQWVRIFEVDSFMKSSMWPRFEALCEFVSNHSGWYPYDVALNYVRTGDHTRIHPDSEVHQDELTMVLYLNEDLTPSDFGETTFYVLKPDDGVHQFIGDGGEVYEAIGTVAPKFGRIAIFTNNIEHSAHPPSTQFLGGRYTFALKVCRTKRLALIKMAYEGLEAVDLDERLQRLKSRLETGKLDDENAISTSQLEGLLQFIKKGTKESMKQEKNELLDLLVREA